MPQQYKYRVKTGRPTKYDPKYCQEVIDYMAQGKSKEAFAGHIDVAKQTIYTWMEAHEEFLDAIKKGEAKCQDFWEEMGIQMALAGQGNATVWIFNMKNRFSWRDKTETEITGKDGQPFRIELINDWLYTAPEGGTDVSASIGSNEGQNKVQSSGVAQESKKDINGAGKDSDGSA